MTSLFDPVTVGAIDCANRIFMAPLTRQRAARGHVPTPLMADYYAQRASAGLIIAEAAGVRRRGGTSREPGQITTIPSQLVIAGGLIGADRETAREYCPKNTSLAGTCSAFVANAPRHATAGILSISLSSVIG